MPRTKDSPYRHDRAEIRACLEQQGLAEALARWSKDAVLPIARVMGLSRPYRRPQPTLTPEQVAELGKKPDQTVAGEWGLPVSTVAKARRSLGIQPFVKVPDLDVVHALSDAELGFLTLEQLKAKTGANVNVLMAERRRRRVSLIPGRGERLSATVSINDMRRVALAAMRAAFPTITLEVLGGVLGITCELVRQIEQQVAVEKRTELSERSA